MNNVCKVATVAVIAATQAEAGFTDSLKSMSKDFITTNFTEKMAPDNMFNGKTKIVKK